MYELPLQYWRNFTKKSRFLKFFCIFDLFGCRHRNRDYNYKNCGWSIHIHKETSQSPNHCSASEYINNINLIAAHKISMGKLGPCKTFRGSSIVDREESGGYKLAQTWARTTNVKTEHMPAGKNLPHASWRRFKTPLLALRIMPPHVKKWQTSLLADKFSSTNQVIIINDLDNALFFYLKFVQVNLDSYHWCDQKKKFDPFSGFRCCCCIPFLTHIPGSCVIAGSVLWSVLPEGTGSTE